MDDKVLEMCYDCTFADLDYNEADRWGGSWVDGCKRGLLPEWNTEEECYECEGYKEVTE